MRLETVMENVVAEADPRVGAPVMSMAAVTTIYVRKSRGFFTLILHNSISILREFQFINVIRLDTAGGNVAADAFFRGQPSCRGGDPCAANMFIVAGQPMLMGANAPRHINAGSQRQICRRWRHRAGNNVECMR